MPLIDLSLPWICHRSLSRLWEL